MNLPLPKTCKQGTSQQAKPQATLSLHLILLHAAPLQSSPLEGASPPLLDLACQRSPRWMQCRPQARW